MTPSALIRLALADLRAVEADPAYAVDMDVWHTPTDTTCHVCLAGAVMAQTHKSDPAKYVEPYEFPPAKRRELLALNELRTGEINFALRHLDIEPPKALPVRIGVSSYEQNRLQFHADMESLAALLQEHGL